MNISFYLPEKYFPSEKWLQAWQEHRPLPLEESGKAAAVHCWIYQTWTLLREAGIETSLVKELPTRGVVLALSGTLDSSLRSNHHASDFFLVDIVADGLPHPAAHLHIVQNNAHAQRLPNSCFIPLWPQAALIPRQKSRATLFERVAFFGDPKNLAEEFFSFSWQQHLQEKLSLEFEIRRADRWHDYSDVDAVVAIRDFSRSRQLHKPATKLYNAWLAGVPFIGGHDSAYQTDGQPGVDYLVASSPKQVLEHLRRLKEDFDFRSRLIQNGSESVKKFNQRATLERWKILIQETLPTLALEWQKKSILQRRCYFVAQRAFCFIDRKLR
ncbi:MAG: glycosyltransferase family 1 protein [Verrucomicrobia bacterium]|nr:glycosyltransferase family 1 protein [Verrucomicrobiota bacterium]